MDLQLGVDHDYIYIFITYSNVYNDPKVPTYFKDVVFLFHIEYCIAYEIMRRVFQLGFYTSLMLILLSGKVNLKPLVVIIHTKRSTSSMKCNTTLHHCMTLVSATTPLNGESTTPLPLSHTLNTLMLRRCLLPHAPIIHRKVVIHIMTTLSIMLTHTMPSSMTKPIPQNCNFFRHPY